MTQAIVGVVLAGGRATRMGGRDKALVELAGQPLLVHVIDRLAPGVARVVVNANRPAEGYACFGLPVIADTVRGFPGPLAGILAGMEWASANTDAGSIATAAADTPFFPTDLVQRLAAAQAGAPGRIALARSAAGLHPTFGLWPVALRDDLAAHLAAGGSRKVSEWAGLHDLVTVDFAPNEHSPAAVDPFFNVNTPDDLRRAEALLRGSRP